MLCDLDREAYRTVRVLNSDGVQDRRQLAWRKLDVHDGTLNLHELVLSGPADLLDGPLREAADRTIRSRTMPVSSEELTVRTSTLGEDVVLVGARSLDPPEERFIAESGLRLGEERVADAIDGVDAVYVAFDCDVLEPDCGVSMFMPEPGGMTPEAAEHVLLDVARAKPVAGLGFSGLAVDPQNVAGLARFCAAVGL